MDHPSAWFEELYAAAQQGAAGVPWDRGVANPLLVGWASERALDGTGRTALVVGSGLGLDAEYVASLGFATTAFDFSATAVARARERFASSEVRYLVGDLLDPPDEWRGAYDFVFESLTVQSLPPAHHDAAIVNVASFVAEGGTLLVVAGARLDSDAPLEGPPWPLTRAELDRFGAELQLHEVIEVEASSREPWRRTWRSELRRALDS